MAETSVKERTATTEGPWRIEAPYTWKICGVDGPDQEVATCFGGTHVQAEANAALIVKAVNSFPALVEALKGLEAFFSLPGEGSIDHFERVADIFYRQTGYLRPGKDCRLHEPEIRKEVWEKWVDAKLSKARSALSEAERAEDMGGE